MIKFHYVNGTVIEDDTEWDRAVVTLQRRGLRFHRTSNNILLPIEHATMTHITFEEEEDGKESTEVEASDEGDAGGDREESESSEEVGREETEKELSPQEKKDAILAHMKEMSECTHERHDIYYQETLVGKNKKPAKRYFPVCAKCGVRERYVKASDLEDEIKENAKQWDK
jgi:hypothetical protein